MIKWFDFGSQRLRSQRPNKCFYLSWKFTSNIQMDSKMNWFDFGGWWSQGHRTPRSYEYDISGMPKGNFSTSDNSIGLIDDLIRIWLTRSLWPLITQVLPCESDISISSTFDQLSLGLKDELIGFQLTLHWLTEAYNHNVVILVFDYVLCWLVCTDSLRLALPSILGKESLQLWLSLTFLHSSPVKNEVSCWYGDYYTNWSQEADI